MAPSAVETATPTKLPIEAEDKEALVKRNPYANFAEVEAGRPAYDAAREWTLLKCPKPDWQPGDGANSDDWKRHRHVAIDPWEPGREINLNYKLMISATVPRPIALCSTVTADGRTQNVAPFSYFQCVSTDPPLYSLSFTGREPNDTLKNILATKECCISLTSDSIIEAANFTSANTPPHLSEWPLSGLTPSPSQVVKPPFVLESPYSVECKYFSHQDLYSRVNPSVRTATLVLVEIVRFHVWEDALAADRATADVRKLRPVFRAGGITYGSVVEGFEIPRPEAFRKLREGETVGRLVREQEEGLVAGGESAKM